MLNRRVRERFKENLRAFWRVNCTDHLAMSRNHVFGLEIRIDDRTLVCNAKSTMTLRDSGSLRRYGGPTGSSRSVVHNPSTDQS